MIQILMTTYNGERYLQEQLDSILAQTYTDWRLCIHDDGSSDHTTAILSDYASRFPEQITLTNDGQRLGACRAFMYLMEHTDNADYYAFCDQDDVWLPDKLQLTINAMQQAEQQHGTAAPIVVHSDLMVVDEQLQLVHPSFWAYSFLLPDVINREVHFLAICNTVTGCTMLLNNAARRCSLPMGENAYMHDAWIAVQTLLHGGKVIPLHTPTVHYRQHANNVLGAQRYTFNLRLKNKYKLAQRAYRMSHPAVFPNIMNFIYWKLRLFLAEHTS